MSAIRPSRPKWYSNVHFHLSWRGITRFLHLIVFVTVALLIWCAEMVPAHITQEYVYTRSFNGWAAYLDFLKIEGSTVISANQCGEFSFTGNNGQILRSQFSTPPSGEWCSNYSILPETVITDGIYKYTGRGLMSLRFDYSQPDTKVWVYTRETLKIIMTAILFLAYILTVGDI